MGTKFWKKIKVKNDSKASDLCAAFVAELLGTAMLLFVGCMGCTLRRDNILVEGPFSYGLAVMVVMQCFGHISGAHVNPTISIAGMMLGQLPIVNGIFYIIAQFLGAIAGFGMLKVLLVRIDTHGTQIVIKNQPGFCSPLLHPEISQVRGLFIEFLISFILIMTICGIWDDRNKDKTDSTALRFGLSNTGLIIAAETTTGGLLNPARTFAPALFNNYWRDLWIFWVGQLAGGITAAVLYGILFYESGFTESESKVDETEDEI